MTTPGDPGHVTGHNTLEDGIRAQASRFGVPVTLTGPFAVGAPNHIGVHNLELTALEQIAAVAGVTLTLPDTASLGDTGHTSDHDLMTAAVAALAAAPAWNDAVGGVITTVGNLRRHTFTSGGTFTPIRFERPFTVAVFAGGGGGGGAIDDFYADAGNQGGFYTTDVSLTGQGYTVTIGNGGAAGIGSFAGGPTDGGYGGPSLFGSLYTAGGGGKGGGGYPATNYPGLPGVPSPAADGGVTTPLWANFGLPATVGNGGASNRAGQNGFPGQPGAVVIQYQIGG